MGFFPKEELSKFKRQKAPDLRQEHLDAHDDAEKNKLFRKYPYALKELSEGDWEYIRKYRGNVLYERNYRLEQGLKFPGFITDTRVRSTEPYYSWWKELFLDNEDLVSPRGNLGMEFLCNGCPVILCGIAPGFSDLSRGEPKWLLGPSSKLLHKLLYCIGVYPYFTNIYKKSFTGNNSDAASAKELDQALRLLGQEINILGNEIWSGSKMIYIMTLGKYKEYSSIMKYVKIFQSVKMVQLYHPSYFLRNGAVSIENSIVKQEIDKAKKLLDMGEE